MTDQIIIDRAPPTAVPAVPADEAVRVRIGSSPQTDPTVLLSLASDPSVTVRAAVALNRAAPVHVDRLLAGDSDERVRTLSRANSPA